MDIKFEKQKNQYNRVNDLYINKSYTIGKACEKVGICKQTYYSIKRKLDNIESANKNIKNTTKKISSKQSGGSNNLSDYILSKPTKKKSNLRNILNVIDTEVQKTGITV
jgi:DNA-binding XRE family transcriptional regulator